jgi:hypothetical protein
MKRLLIALALGCCTCTSRAGVELPVTLERDAPAKISVGSAFDTLPQTGYAPVRVRITNSAKRPQAWQFQFTSTAFGAAQTTMRHTRVLSVPANASRMFDFAVPLSGSVINMGTQTLSVGVAGPGTVAQSAVEFPGTGYSGRALTNFIAMAEPLAGRGESAFAEAAKNNKQELLAAKFLHGDLPEDWRTLVGCAGVWLTATQWGELTPLQRATLQDWVHRGGALFLIGNGAPAGERQHGFGRITGVANEQLDPDATLAAVNSLSTPPNTEMLLEHLNKDPDAWRAREMVGDLRVNVPLLLGLAVLFAAAVGPLNLYLLARSGRRHRLFWTTPAISVAASVVLFLVIVLQDGFGGSGIRTALVHILPDERKQAILQEQLARTGVIGSAKFETREPTFITPIKLTAERHGFAPLELENIERQFAGSWFRSRNLQAHWLECVTSTRAEVALLNAAELHDENVQPVILSSIGVPLAELFYRDARGDLWRAENLHPGQKTPLTRADAMLQLPRQTGPRMRETFARIAEQRGYFFARSTAPADLIDTLPAIRWHDEQVIYTGPVTTSSTHTAAQ